MQFSIYNFCISTAANSPPNFLMILAKLSCPLPTTPRTRMYECWVGLLGSCACPTASIVGGWPPSWKQCKWIFSTFNSRQMPRTKFAQLLYDTRLRLIPIRAEAVLALTPDSGKCVNQTSSIIQFP